MAKFNTLAGGYYGKLGATVGQRWKNLRTVRAYVVPNNPRTAAQQANRKLFSDCVPYAQLAGQMNPKVTAFDTTSKTLWNCRMSTARALQDLNRSQLDLIPLYPTSFSVPHTITSANVTEIIDQTHIKITTNDLELSEERVLTMIFFNSDVSDWTSSLIVAVGTNGENGGNEWTFRLPEPIELSETIMARFVSSDDTDSSTDLIASPMLEVVVGEIPDIEISPLWTATRIADNIIRISAETEVENAVEATISATDLIFDVGGEEQSNGDFSQACVISGSTFYTDVTISEENVEFILANDISAIFQDVEINITTARANYFSDPALESFDFEPW